MRLYKPDKQMMAQIVQNTLEALLGGKMSVTITLNEMCRLPAPKPEEKKRIHITSLAEKKMKALVDNCSQEIAWHGLVKEEDGVYIIYDILCYPQSITSTTVNATDNYDLWLDALPDEQFNFIRMQGHSHVHMHATPSATDYTYYDTLIKHIKNYYIFIVLNKSNQMHIEFYDIANNIIYSREDMDITYDVDSFDGKEWYTREAAPYLVVTPTKTYEGYSDVRRFLDDDYYPGSPGTVTKYTPPKEKKARL